MNIRKLNHLLVIAIFCIELLYLELQAEMMRRRITRLEVQLGMFRIIFVPEARSMWRNDPQFRAIDNGTRIVQSHSQ